jgi:alpha-galactosidase
MVWNGLKGIGSGVLFFIALARCGPAPRVDLGPESGGAYKIRYDFNRDGEIWFRNAQIQLRFDRDLYCRVFWRKNEKLYSINDIPPHEETAKPTHYLEVNGKELLNFLVDYDDFGMSDIKTPFGAGKQFHIAGYAKTAAGLSIKKTLKIDSYQDYPDTALITASYTNQDPQLSIPITRVVQDFFRMDAARDKAGLPGYAFSSFMGSSQLPGPTNAQMLNSGFSRTDTITPSTPEGRIPFLDLWTDSMGMAIGELSLPPYDLSLSLRVAPDNRVEMWLQSSQPHELKPKETLTAPRSFLMMHTGDYQVALERYNTLKRKLGALVAPSK